MRREEKIYGSKRKTSYHPNNESRASLKRDGYTEVSNGWFEDRRTGDVAWINADGHVEHGM